VREVYVYDVEISSNTDAVKLDGTKERGFVTREVAELTGNE
jgi:hypothetical protein